MTLRRVSLIVLVCLILAFCIDLAQFPFGRLGSMPRLYGNLATLVLRDVSLIVFLAFLYRRSA